jgi:hypothetical protein
MVKKAKRKTVGKKVQDNLEEIKKDLDDLRAKLGMTKRGDFMQVPLGAAKQLGDTASEIIKKASDVFEKALKVAQYSAMGAIEGGKKAIDEEFKQKKTAKKKKP